MANKTKIIWLARSVTLLTCDESSIPDEKQIARDKSSSPEEKALARDDSYTIEKI